MSDRRATPARHALGIDLGGTQIKMLCVDRDGHVLASSIIATGDDGSRDWRARLVEEARRIQTELRDPVDRIGLAAPGLVARDGRSIAFMPGRLSGLVGCDWGEFLGDVGPSSRQIPVVNDAQAALLGELWVGAGSRPLEGTGTSAPSRRVPTVENALLLTLGTGVGGAVLANGALLRGHLGRAGHLGHISLDPRGAPDIVGTPGSLEDAIGECTLERRSLGRFSTTRALLAAHASGDEAATRVWMDSIEALGAAIAGLINCFDPEIVIVGGGIAECGDRLFDPLADALDRFEWRPDGQRVRILRATLRERAGAFGAAFHALQEAKDLADESADTTAHD